MPFKPGNSFGKGRPLKSKNLLPIIRDKVLHNLHGRIRELEEVKVEELLRFAQSIMPKDISVKVSPDIQYISNTPRPVTHIIDIPQEVLEHKVTQAGENGSLEKEKTLFEAMPYSEFNDGVRAGMEMVVAYIQLYEKHLGEAIAEDKGE